MREKVLGFMRDANRPVSTHEIAKALHEAEPEVLGMFNDLRNEVCIVYVPLSERADCGVYYKVRKRPIHPYSTNNLTRIAEENKKW